MYTGVGVCWGKLILLVWALKMLVSGVCWCVGLPRQHTTFKKKTMKKDEKRPPETMSEVATSSEVTILNTDGSVKRVGKYREMFAETQDHEAFYVRLALFIKNKLVLIK